MGKHASGNKYTVTTSSSVEAGFFGGSARWTLDVHDDYHVIDFSHTGILGQRMVKVDDRFVIKRKSSLKLVGRESFTIGGSSRHHGEILIEPVGIAHYRYTLFVDGAPYADYLDFVRAQDPLLNLPKAEQQSHVHTNPDHDVSTAL